MKLEEDVTLVVLSTDAFEDCWHPFFTLLSAYWPDRRPPILLDSETKNYEHPGLDLRCSRVLERTDSWPTWTESLLLGLEQVETPLVITMLDDFFVNGAVDVPLLERCTELMLKRGYPTIALTEHGLHRSVTPSDDPALLLVSQQARYRLTTSPSLWSVEALRSYAHPPENIWQFEILGSWRARRRPDPFFIVNPAALSNGKEGVIPYYQAEDDTGIVKGAWQPGIQELFQEHDIVVDYSRRGFFAPSGRIASRYRTLRKLLENPRRCLLGGSFSVGT